MATTETIREIQTLVAGRNTDNPVATSSITAANGQPNGDVGFTVESVINAFIGVQLQAQAGRVAAVITIGDVVEGEDYEIDFNAIGAVQYTAQPGDDATAIAAGLVAAAGSTFSAVGDLSAGAGTITMLGADDSAYTVAVAATGAATISAVREATSVVWRRWVRLPGSSTWFDIMDSERTASRNEAERHIVSGIDRVYVEIVSTDGAVVPVFARCLPE